MREAEARDQPYLTKRRLTKNGKGLIKKLFRSDGGDDAEQGGEGLEDTLTLSGWRRAWRVVVPRRQLNGELPLAGKDENQGLLAFKPHKHFEAISSRPLLPHGVATLTQHAGQKRLTISSTPAQQAVIPAVLTSLAGFLSSLKATAEQLTDAQRLRAILSRAFAKFMLATAAPPAPLTAQFDAN